VIVGAVPVKGVPSDKVPLIVPGPVTAIDKLVLPPLHIEVAPLIVPVARTGCAFTVTDVPDEVQPLLFFAVTL
jgi:hypothetical protein